LFKLTPAEARATDPQHRQFLECAWYALAYAGYDAFSGLGRVGTYATKSTNGYRAAVAGERPHAVEEFQADIANSMGHMSGSIAYRFGFTGPAITVQTACSSSLVAVHLAAQGLLAGDCDVAIAGGASITWPQQEGYVYTEGGIMSRDGHCRPFDAGASGTVRGEGVGVVVLKRLQNALQARDTIHCVILGSAINNDGGVKIGYTAPGFDGQVDVIRRALNSAGISPGSVAYLETHGTGTSLGDMLEFSAIKEAYGKRSDQAPLHLGTLKANLGHLDSCSGIVALIKAAHVVREGKLPPALHFEAPNSSLGLDQSHYKFFSSAQLWNAQAKRRAGVSAFGLGGTNAHVILEEAPQSAAATGKRKSHLLVLSAENSENLSILSLHTQRDIISRPEFHLDDIAFTFALGRTPMPWRLAVVGENVTDICMALASTPGFDHKCATLCFAISPRPSSNVSWISHLHETEPVFRRWLVLSATKLRNAGGSDVLGALQNQDRTAWSSAETLSAHFCSQVALVKMMAEWGVSPAVIMSEAAGNLAASYLSGAVSLDDVCSLIATVCPLNESNADFGTLVQKCSSFLRTIKTIEPDVRWLSLPGGRNLSAAALQQGLFWADSALNGLDTTKVAGAPTLSEMLNLSDFLILRLGYSPETNATLLWDVPARIVLDVNLESASSTTKSMAAAIGKLWQNKIPVNWKEYYAWDERSRVPLSIPTLVMREFVPETQVTASIPTQPHRVSHANVLPAAPPSAPLKSDLEQGILSAMRQVLGIPTLTSDDDFFHQGGDSLSAVQLVSLIRETFSVELPLQTLFDHPNSHALTVALEGMENGTGHERATRIEAPRCEQQAYAPAHKTQSGNERPPLDFSIFFFSANVESGSDPVYRYFLAACRWADGNEFDAVWIPERHFHQFGGAFPNPALLAAAAAVNTEKLNLRAGSVVLPLHDPVRIVEDWAMIDNLSNGRIGISFAPGFHPTDFVLKPEAYKDRRELFWNQLASVQNMWSQRKLNAVDGLKRDCTVSIYPAPVLPSLPTWITASDKAETFIQAGRLGANVLTAMMGLSMPELASRISVYREALAGRPGRVTVMLHTFVHPDERTIKQHAHPALRQYLATHLDFSGPRNEYARVSGLGSEDQEALLNHALRKYLNQRSLIGVPDQCWSMLNELREIGTDEVACLIDFGVDYELSLKSLVYVNELRQAALAL
jgi:natural product biosynthesis luciferase-like monooxygenase protein